MRITLFVPVSLIAGALCAAAGCNSPQGSESTQQGAEQEALHRRYMGPLVQVSTNSTFSASCAGPSSNNGSPGTNLTNTNVEPSISVNPWDHAHLVAAWQQNRWNNSYSEGLASAYSWDWGRSWTQSGPIPFTACTGGPFERVAHARVRFTKWGELLVMGQGANVTDDTGANGATAQLVSRSTNGGRSWEPATVLISSPGENFAPGTVYNDFPELTADPANPEYAYAAFDQYNVLTAAACPTTEGNDYYQPTLLSVTRNAGATWSTPTPIGPVQLDTAMSAVKVLPLAKGQLGLGFDWERDFTSYQSDGGPDCSTSTNFQNWAAIITSSDRGTTWSSPIVIDKQVFPWTLSAAVDGGFTQINDYTQPVFGSDPSTNTVYVVWPDTRFEPAPDAGTPNTVSDLAFSMSTNGGTSWSPTIKINPPASVSAFLPAIAVSDTGRVVVRYYDLRNNQQPPSAHITTTEWVTYCDQNCASPGGWKEYQNQTFDLAKAPVVKSGTVPSGVYVGNFESVIAFGNTIVTASTAPLATPNTLEVFVRSTTVAP